MPASFRELRAQRLSDEVGTIHKQADLPVALVYPSPYHVGMSSLGYQTIYRELNALPGVRGRAGVPARRRRGRPPPPRAAGHLRIGPAHRRLSGAWRSRWPTSWRWPAWCDCLDLAGIPPLASRAGARAQRHPLVVVGGPLTFSNPVPAGPCADVMVMGEAEEASPRSSRPWPATAAVTPATARRCWRHWPGPGFYVPSIHGETAAGRRRRPRRPAAGVFADPHPAHRAVGHVPDRARAGLPPRLHLLRDAPLDQRGHAPGGARAGAGARARGRAAGWAWWARR